ncbi:CopZ family metallochaperone [Paradesulfitobacterium ferrireducens]|uniref:CopZ family metallochaperone n=1 Tax=Paradesulfitobacterium ferrireducens TaxID=2816476 RepID=UPI001A8EC43E|nr:heavy-metal-associated domain-containing protein [Paradesulfitobacterium ferrireducens]
MPRGSYGQSYGGHSLRRNPTLLSRDRIVLRIKGMTCGHCKAAVERALLSVPGVTGAQVNLLRQQAVVLGLVDRALLIQAVDDAGYFVTGLV